MFDWLTTEVWDGIREWREFIRSLLYLDHRDHLCYIISFTLHGIGIGTYFVEERLTVLIHRWRFCQSIVDTLMKLTSVQLRFLLMSIILLVWKFIFVMKMTQLLYEKVLALTIVVRWSSDLHIGFSVLHYLIHKTSIGGAAALLWSNGHCHMISRGSDGSEATFNVPQVPTAGQVTNGANPLWWKGRFRPTSAQCPLVGAFRHSFHFFFLFFMHQYFPSI